MKVIRIFAALAAAVLLAGCLPVTTKTPVGTTVGLKADPALTGTWKGKSLEDKKAQEAYFHFLQVKNGATRLAVVMATGEGDDGWTIFNITSASLGANHYLNAVMTFDKDEAVDGNLKGANIPVLYVIKGRTMTLYLLDEEKAKDAIKAGKIKGTIEQGTSGDVVLTSEAKELDAFMTTPETAQLFKPLFVLRKVN